MERGLSLYLDLLRLIAAVEVFAYHISGFPAFGFRRGVWNGFGHEAVTIFFVLSGFVIRYTAGRSDKTFGAFATSRITRVYSVAIPCLVLTWLFDMVGHQMMPQLYEGLVTDGSDLLRLAIGGVMLNEAWVSVQMLSNTPYWSISYEFWYYFLFAFVFYFKGLLRWAGVAVVALICGPKILLLYPVWLLGWAAFSETRSGRFPKWFSWLLFIQPVFVLWAYVMADLAKLDGKMLVPLIGYDGWRNGMAWSRFLFTDMLLGLSIAGHLVGAKGLGAPLARMLGWVERPLKWLAGQSFTLYLLHQPALLFCGAILSGLGFGSAYGWAVGAATLGVVGLVALVTETQRHRLKPIIQWLVAWFGRHFETLLARHLRQARPAA